MGWRHRCRNVKGRNRNECSRRYRGRKDSRVEHFLATMHPGLQSDMNLQRLIFSENSMHLLNRMQFTIKGMLNGKGT